MLNRVKSKHFPNTVCGVVKQDAQFSFYQDKYSNTPKKKFLWKSSKKLAREILNDKYRKRIGGAKWFYAPKKCNPKWAKNLKHVAMIGNHRFMRR